MWNFVPILYDSASRGRFWLSAVLVLLIRAYFEFLNYELCNWKCFIMLTDLLTLVMFVSCSGNYREAYWRLPKSDGKEEMITASSSVFVCERSVGRFPDLCSIWKDSTVSAILIYVDHILIKGLDLKNPQSVLFSIHFCFALFEGRYTDFDFLLKKDAPFCDNYIRAIVLYIKISARDYERSNGIAEQQIWILKIRRKCQLFNCTVALLYAVLWTLRRNN